MKNYSKGALQSANKKLVVIVAISLVLILGASVVLSVGFGKYGTDTSKWFKSPAPVEQAPGVDQGLVVQGSSTGLISLSSTNIAPEDYAVNGVAETAENAKTITATITDEEWTDGKVVWSIAWASEDSWTASNPVANYLTITPSADTKSAVLQMVKGGFRKQAIVSAKLNSQPDSTPATVTVDYLRRMTNSTVMFDLDQMEFGQTTHFTNNYTYSQDGTLIGTPTINKITIGVPSIFTAGVKANRYFTTGLKTLGMNEGAISLKDSISINWDAEQHGDRYFEVPSLYNFFVVNGNGAMGGYVYNAYIETLNSIKTGAPRYLSITMSGVYTYGDISIPFTTQSYVPKNYGTSKLTMAKVNLPNPAVSVDASGFVF